MDTPARHLAPRFAELAQRFESLANTVLTRPADETYREFDALAAQGARLAMKAGFIQQFNAAMPDPGGRGRIEIRGDPNDPGHVIEGWGTAASFWREAWLGLVAKGITAEPTNFPDPSAFAEQRGDAAVIDHRVGDDPRPGLRMAALESATAASRLAETLAPSREGARREWLRSDEAAARSGLSTEAIRVRAFREKWRVEKSGHLNCYRLEDLKRTWPHLDFETEPKDRPHRTTAK